jgi:hypothetical protein
MPFLSRSQLGKKDAIIRRMPRCFFSLQRCSLHELLRDAVTFPAKGARAKVAMRMAVMRAEAIGLLYVGWLQHAGAGVTFLARGHRLAALGYSPMIAEGGIPFKLTRVKGMANPAQLAPVDVVLLCVKPSLRQTI